MYEANSEDAECADSYAQALLELATGPGEPTSEPDGPSTEGHNKLPGKQGWSRKSGKSGKSSKSSKDRKDRRPADDEDRRERDANRPSPRKPSSEERSRLPGAPAEDDHE